MAKLRYNRTFKKAIIAILICYLLFGFVLVFSIVAKIQYDNIVSKMEPIEATITDISLDIHTRGPSEQEIYVTYEVDGVVYINELKTDTTISFSAGIGAHYSLGDRIDIFYDPQNPEVIATLRSVRVGYFYMAISLVGLALVSFALFCVLKRSRGFMITQEEYEKEGEELKKSRLAKKRKKSKAKEKARKMPKMVKIILIALASAVGAFILFLLLGALLASLGH